MALKFSLAMGIDYVSFLLALNSCKLYPGRFISSITVAVLRADNFIIRGDQVTLMWSRKKMFTLLFHRDFHRQYIDKPLVEYRL